MFYKCWKLQIVDRQGLVISMYFQMSRHFHTIVDNDIQNTLDCKDLSGNIPDLETERRMSHLYFPGKSSQSMCLRHVTLHNRGKKYDFQFCGTVTCSCLFVWLLLYLIVCFSLINFLTFRFFPKNLKNLNFEVYPKNNFFLQK